MTLGLGLDDIIAEAVERPHADAAPRLARAQLDAFAHLLACLVRKRQAEHFLRLGAAGIEDVCDAVGQRVRLARAGWGCQEDVGVEIFGDGTLL